MVYITQSDIAARMPLDAFNRIFDRNGTGAIDTAFVATCIATAQSTLDMKLGAAFAAGLVGAGGTLDERIKAQAVMIAIFEAVRYTPLAAKDGPYWEGYQNALAFLDAVRKDDGERPTAASKAGIASPLATVNNTVSANAVPNDPFGRVADGKDRSNF